MSGVVSSAASGVPRPVHRLGDGSAAAQHSLAYNTRFLILPWVTVPHLASHILGRMARAVAGDWQRLYAHPMYLLETFIDPEQFRDYVLAAATG